MFEKTGFLKKKVKSLVFYHTFNIKITKIISFVSYLANELPENNGKPNIIISPLSLWVKRKYSIFGALIISPLSLFQELN